MRKTEMRSVDYSKLKSKRKKGNGLTHRKRYSSIESNFSQRITSREIQSRVAEILLRSVEKKEGEGLC